MSGLEYSYQHSLSQLNSFFGKYSNHVRDGHASAAPKATVSLSCTRAGSYVQAIWGALLCDTQQAFSSTAAALLAQYVLAPCWVVSRPMCRALNMSPIPLKLSYPILLAAVAGHRRCTH